MALIRPLTASRLKFLGKLALAGRFDEIARRLLRRRSLEEIDGALDAPRPPSGSRALNLPQPPWRVAAFVHESGLSGAPISLMELATALAERKLAHVQLLAPSEGPVTAACRSRGLDIAIHGVELRDLLTRRRWTKAAAHLAGVVRAFGPDIVHANSIMTAPGLAAARLSGIPTLLNVREDRPDRTLFSFLPHDIAMTALETLRSADEIVFVSEASRDGWRRYFAADAQRVIPNALRPASSRPGDRAELRARLGIADTTTIVLCVGSYCDRKGQVDLVDAIGRLPAPLYRRVRVVMIGEAEPVYLADLQRRVEGLDADRRKAVSLLPAQAQADAFYRAADIFVCCSRAESYPRVTLEAMRAGLPIVTTPVAGIVEQLNADEALFYAPGDVEALTQGIAHLVEDPGLRSQLGGRASAAFARHGDFDTMVDRYVEVYRRAFERTAGGDQRPVSP